MSNETFPVGSRVKIIGVFSDNRKGTTGRIGTVAESQWANSRELKVELNDYPKIGLTDWFPYSISDLEMYVPQVGFCGGPYVGDSVKVIGSFSDIRRGTTGRIGTAMSWSPSGNTYQVKIDNHPSPGMNSWFTYGIYELELANKADLISQMQSGGQEEKTAEQPKPSDAPQLVGCGEPQIGEFVRISGSFSDDRKGTTGRVGMVMAWVRDTMKYYVKLENYPEIGSISWFNYTIDEIEPADKLDMFGQIQSDDQREKEVLRQQQANTTKDPIRQLSWEEFRNTGLLSFVNTFLHIFGWALVFSYTDGSNEPVSVYPARVRFRGFSEEQVAADYIKLSQYMVNNSDELLEEAKD